MGKMSENSENRKPRTGNRKGVLLTIGLAFYCAAMLTLATVLVAHTRESREASNDASAVEAVSQAFAGIEKSFRDVFEKASGISLSLNGSAVVISEALPNNYAGGYGRAISGLASFAEGNAGGGAMSVSVSTTASRNSMPLVIKPYNITITHPGYNDAILVSPQSGVQSYAIRLNVPAEVNCSSSLSAGLDISLAITVTGDYNTSCSVSQSISALGTSLYGINNGTILVNVTDGTLKVESSQNGAEAEISVGPIPLAGTNTEVYLGDSMTVALATPAITRSAPPRLL